MERFTISVPATTANLGLGFDSMGMALVKYLTIQAELSDTWSFTYTQEALEVLPADERNLVCQTAQQVAAKYQKTMPALAIEMTSDIPLTHGQGSSSSAIVAGIELANHYLNLNLSEREKVEIGSDIEGHPDNVGPCVTGDVFIGFYEDGQLYYEVIELPNIQVIMTTPPYEISTAEARKALPEQYEKGQAIAQNAANNVMVLKMLHQDYPAMGALMMRDQFHEPYREHLIPEFMPLRQLGQELGAYATVISGAGPSILTLAAQNKANDILQAFQEAEPDCQHELLDIHRKQ